MIMTKDEMKRFAELKRIAKGSKIKVTKARYGRVRFKGNGQDVNRMIGDNVSPVSPKMQLKAMIKISKRKRLGKVM